MMPFPVSGRIRKNKENPSTVINGEGIFSFRKAFSYQRFRFCNDEGINQLNSF